MNSILEDYLNIKEDEAIAILEQETNQWENWKIMGQKSTLGDMKIEAFKFAINRIKNPVKINFEDYIKSKSNDIKFDGSEIDKKEILKYVDNIIEDLKYFRNVIEAFEDTNAAIDNFKSSTNNPMASIQPLAADKGEENE